MSEPSIFNTFDRAKWMIEEFLERAGWSDVAVEVTQATIDIKADKFSALAGDEGQKCL